MTLVSTDSRTASAPRSRATRFSDGVIAEYIHALARTPVRSEPLQAASDGQTEAPVRPSPAARPDRMPGSDSKFQRRARVLIANAIRGACGGGMATVPTPGV